jgi:hypothetical protein
MFSLSLTTAVELAYTGLKQVLTDLNRFKTGHKIVSFKKVQLGKLECKR